MACDTLIDSNSVGSTGYNKSLVGKYLGQAFTMGGISKTMCAAVFKIRADTGCGSLNITYEGRLYACTGIAGTDGNITGEPLAVSTNTINLTEDEATPVLRTFNFSGYTLQANTDYVIVCYCIAWSGNGDCYVYYGGEEHSGNLCGEDGESSSYDSVFYIYKESGWSAKINNITPGKVMGIAVADIGKIIGV